MALSVYAPASIGNVGVGFDLLGAAVSPIDGDPLGDEITIYGIAEDDFKVSLAGAFAHALPQDSRDNIVYQCSHYFRDKLINRLYERVNDKMRQRFSFHSQSSKTTVPYLSMQLEKNLPVGSGLGSSAASIVAAFHALNVYFNRPFEQSELLRMMGHFEGQISGSVHYDNVAPCYLGGITLMADDEQIYRSLPVPDSWYWVMAYSGISVSTKMAREVLPKQLPMQTAIEYARNLSVFVDALHRQKWQMAAQFIVDPVAEPHRRELLPGFVEVTEALKEQGALACGISGSGPTVFAVAPNLEKARAFEQYMVRHYLRNDSGFCRICTIDKQGARAVPLSDTANKGLNNATI